MPRIPFVTPDTAMTPEQRKVYDAVASGPRGIVQGPVAAPRCTGPSLPTSGSSSASFCAIAPRCRRELSEIAILVTAQRWRCQLEWHLHAGFALKADVPRAVIDDIHAGRRPASAEPQDARGL